MLRARSFFIAAALLLIAAPSFADDNPPPARPAPPVRIRATIEKFDNGVLTVKSEMGDDVMLTVTPKTNVSAVAAKKLSDIKPNDFIGVTAMTGADGKMTATEVHIFPEQMRGAGEGHYPWDKGKDSSMTNGAVAGMVDSANGKDFKISYKNKSDGSMGSSDIDISPNIPIVMFVPGDPSLLKPGAHIVTFAAKLPDGKMIALGIVAEKDGVKPPM
jgi:hypothetical protein